MKGYFLLTLVVFGFMNSCVNDEGEVKKITDFQDAPDEQSQNLKMVYSDSGRTKFHLFAVISETFTLPEHITNFRKFLKVDFFDSNGVKVSDRKSVV